MKKLMMVVGAAMMLTGCAVGEPLERPVAVPGVCDVRAADWAAPDCEVVQSQGAYKPDTRYVCPQADGTEWDLRIAYGPDGAAASQQYERYTTVGAVGTPGAHVPDHTICLVGLDGAVFVGPQ